MSLILWNIHRGEVCYSQEVIQSTLYFCTSLYEMLIVFLLIFCKVFYNIKRHVYPNTVFYVV